MHLILSEVLNLVEKAKTKEEKIQVLKNNESPILRAVMRINFDPNIKMDLPEGEPPFKKQMDRPIGEQETRLEHEYRRFYIWLDPKTNLSKVKKETLFVEMLEGLHVSEAELICLAKDRKLSKKWKSLKEEIVRAAFPTTLPPVQET